MRTKVAVAGDRARGGAGIYSLKPRFQQALGGIERFLVRKRVHPDYLTFGALVLSVLGGAALYGSVQAAWLLLLVPVVVLTRTALNALDGLVARGTGLARPWGEVLNEVCDRLSDVALFAGVGLASGSSSVLAACVIVAMLLSSYVGVLSKAAGSKRQYGGIMGKADRMIYLGIASVVAFLLPNVPVFTWFLALCLVGLLVTLIQRLKATYNDLKPFS